MTRVKLFTDDIGFYGANFIDNLSAWLYQMTEDAGCEMEGDLSELYGNVYEPVEGLKLALYCCEGDESEEHKNWKRLELDDGDDGVIAVLSEAADAISRFHMFARVRGYVEDETADNMFDSFDSAVYECLKKIFVSAREALRDE